MGDFPIFQSLFINVESLRELFLFNIFNDIHILFLPVSFYFSVFIYLIHSTSFGDFHLSQPGDENFSRIFYRIHTAKCLIDMVGMFPRYIAPV